MVGQWHIGSVLLVFVVFVQFLQLIHTANILVVFTYCSPSPFLVLVPYVKALVRKGHQLTIISSSKLIPNIDGVHHIRVEKLEQVMEDFINSEIDDDEFLVNKWHEASVISQVYYNSSLYVLSHPGVQSLLQDANAHFDMVILQASLTDALYGFAVHYNATLVGFSIYETAWNTDYLVGNIAPSVYEPMSPEGYSHGGSVLDKFRNWIYITEEWLLERLIYLPKQMKLYKRFFNQSADSLYNIRRNFSLMLINQHFSLGRARSNVPNVIEVAGIHLNQPTEQMDISLQRFLDEAEHGVIYFSMGIEIIAKWLPPNMIQTLEQSFNQLQQRVVWKYELETLRNKSENIYLSPYLPQRELLAHPKVKLFVTHAGILSIIEAAYNGVPMLCLPVYYDQHGNADQMNRAGVAQTQDINTMTVESTTKAIKELIEDPRYVQNAKRMSMRLRDQPMSPLDTAVWWTEYVLRHQGAPHMRLSEEDMSFMHYYNLDIISMLFGRIGLVLLIITCLCFKIVCCFGKPIRIRLTVPIVIRISPLNKEEEKKERKR